jgi:outer membrane protein TolC
MRALVAVQRIARAELLRVEAQEAEAEQAHDALRELAGLREEMLRLQIGARTDELLTIGEDLRAEVAAPAPAALDTLVATAARRRLDVRALELGVVATEERRNAERARALPQVSAFAVTDYARPNARAVIPAEEFGWSWSAGVQLTWSLPDALASRTTTRRLDAEARALRADRESVLQQARIEVLSAQQGVHLAKQAIATSRKGLIAAEETYRVRAALLAAERATAVEIVDAQTTLTRARIAALDAHIDLRIAIAELDHALGTDTTP